jgi:hypothetical protein
MAGQVVLTPPGVCSFLNLQKARAIVEGADPRFSLTLIFNREAQQKPEFKKLEQAIDAEVKSRWPNKIPAGLMSCFHDGAEKADQYSGYNAGDIYISPWSKNKPGCVDAQRQDIIDFSEYYAGWLARANVRPFSFDTAGKRGVSLFLESVQFLRPGPRLDGRKAASESFPIDEYSDDEELV